jgi:hypothetical protein
VGAGGVEPPAPSVSGGSGQLAAPRPAPGCSVLPQLNGGIAWGAVRWSEGCREVRSGKSLACPSARFLSRVHLLFARMSPLPGRCFRMIAHPGEAGPTHCPEPVAWRGSWRAPNGRRYPGSRPAKATGRRRTRAATPPLRLAAGRRRGCLAIPLTDPRSRELAGDNDWAAVDDAAVPRR